MDLMVGVKLAHLAFLSCPAPGVVNLTVRATPTDEDVCVRLSHGHQHAMMEKLVTAMAWREQQSERAAT